MSAMTFDTHRFIGKLKDAGMNEKQAEAVADALREAQDGADLATKKDLSILKADLQKEIAELKYDLLKWIIGLSMAQFALMIGVIMRLPH